MATEHPKKDEPKKTAHPEGGHAPKKETHAHEKPAAKPPARSKRHPKPAKKAAPPQATGKKGKAETKTKPAPKETAPIKVVEKATPAYVPNAKPTLSREQKSDLALRRTLSARRPWFWRQQWYEYKRLANSGWRKPTGIDSAMRRHFGYEQPVVRIGFAGPRSVRGLHPSGFREVPVETLGDLKRIDPKTQAARVSRGLGTRKLKLVYAEADKLGIRILNRRTLA